LGDAKRPARSCSLCVGRRSPRRSWDVLSMPGAGFRQSDPPTRKNVCKRGDAGGCAERSGPPPAPRAQRIILHPHLSQLPPVDGCDFIARSNLRQYIYVSSDTDLITVHNGERFGVDGFDWVAMFYTFAGAMAEAS
jgi:hypothetical protein